MLSSAASHQLTKGLIMKRLFSGLAATIGVMCLTATTAWAAPTTTQTAADAETNRALIAAANQAPIQLDKRSPQVSLGGASTNAPMGSYPRRKGMILVTSDAFKGLIPTGHAAIIHSYSKVVESIGRGVVLGDNDWYASKSQAYGVTVRGTTAAQDATAADWAHRQIGKPYNLNYLDTGTRRRFYCSQLVWASFMDNFGINLDTGAWGWAVHPMELVNTDKTYLTYRRV